MEEEEKSKERELKKQLKTWERIYKRKHNVEKVTKEDIEAAGMISKYKEYWSLHDDSTDEIKRNKGIKRKRAPVKEKQQVTECPLMKKLLHFKPVSREELIRHQYSAKNNTKANSPPQKPHCKMENQPPISPPEKRDIGIEIEECTKEVQLKKKKTEERDTSPYSSGFCHVRPWGNARSNKYRASKWLKEYIEPEEFFDPNAAFDELKKVYEERSMKLQACSNHDVPAVPSLADSFSKGKGRANFRKLNLRRGKGRGRRWKH